MAAVYSLNYVNYQTKDMQHSATNFYLGSLKLLKKTEITVASGVHFVQLIKT